MIQPKYKIDETIFIPFRVTGIAIENRKGEERILYRVSSPGDTEHCGGNRELYEEEMPENDYILAETYEAEINALKDEVARWKEEYEDEHRELTKLKNSIWSEFIQKDGDFSHNPEKNVYAKMP